jgi:hypothetical protein
MKLSTAHQSAMPSPRVRAPRTVGYLAGVPTTILVLPDQLLQDNQRTDSLREKYKTCEVYPQRSEMSGSNDLFANDSRPS